LLASSLLVPPRSDMSRSRRLSILAAEVRCHRPPTAPGIPRRFNSFASPRWETKPAAISFRMVGSKASAWVSAARLPANAPCILRLPGEVSPRTGSIGRLWPRLARRWPMLRLCRGPDLFGQQQIDRPRLIRVPANKRRPAQEACKPGRAFHLPLHPRSGGSEHSSGGEAGSSCITSPLGCAWRVTSLGARVATADPRRRWSYHRRHGYCAFQFPGVRQGPY
jgi:hypothetical protein